MNTPNSIESRPVRIASTLRWRRGEGPRFVKRTGEDYELPVVEWYELTATSNEPVQRQDITVTGYGFFTVDGEVQEELGQQYLAMVGLNNLPEDVQDGLYEALLEQAGQRLEDKREPSVSDIEEQAQAMVTYTAATLERLIDEAQRNVDNAGSTAVRLTWQGAKDMLVRERDDLVQPWDGNEQLPDTRVHGYASGEIQRIIGDVHYGATLCGLSEPGIRRVTKERDSIDCDDCLTVLHSLNPPTGPSQEDAAAIKDMEAVLRHPRATKRQKDAARRQIDRLRGEDPRFNDPATDGALDARMEAEG